MAARATRFQANEQLTHKIKLRHELGAEQPCNLLPPARDTSQCVHSARAIPAASALLSTARQPGWGKGCSATASMPAPFSRLRCIGGKAGTLASAWTAPATSPQSLPSSTAKLGAGLLRNGLSARAILRLHGRAGTVDNARTICLRLHRRRPYYLGHTTTALLTGRRRGTAPGIPRSLYTLLGGLVCLSVPVQW